MTESRQSPGQAPESVMTPKQCFVRGLIRLSAVKAVLRVPTLALVLRKQHLWDFLPTRNSALTEPVAKQYRYQPAMTLCTESSVKIRGSLLFSDIPST